MDIHRFSSFSLFSFFHFFFFLFLFSFFLSYLISLFHSSREHTIRFYLYMFLYPFFILSLTMIELALAGYVAALAIVQIRIEVVC